ncbi:MAG: SMP-30/gluconolactonase/LRE family protein [Alkalibacterium sp.]|nr:SMP-30/gluconolactonase/LRE family protein [Alkalibacterium sp.]
MTKEVSNQLKPELVFYAGSTLLEGPVWDSEAHLIYCVSIPDQIIYRIDPVTTEMRSYKTNGPVGAVVLDKEGMLLSAEKNGIYSIHPETKERTFVTHPNSDERMRYNDGKMLPNGQFLIGTMGDPDVIDNAATLYVIEGEETKEVLTGLTISNGIGWTEDGQFIYHIDTPTRQVKRYAYHSDTKTVSDEVVVAEIPGDSFPDGMCVDLDGMLWVAEYGGSKVCKWNPETGEKEIEIPMPVTNVTSCCLGGENLEYLYITTAKEQDEALSGGLFRVKLR